MAHDEQRRSPRAGAAALGLILAVAVLAGCGADGANPATGSAQSSPEAGPASAAVGQPAAEAATDSGVSVPAGPPDSAPGPAAATSPSSAPPAASGLVGVALEEHLAQRYEAYWDAFDAARAAPTGNPSVDYPLLGALAAGAQLDISYEAVSAMAEAGEAIAEPTVSAAGGAAADVEHRVRIDRVDATVAELTVCVVNDDVRRIVASNAVVHDGVSTVLSNSTMALADGEWKLIRSQAVAISDGISGCWLEGEAAYPY